MHDRLHVWARVGARGCTDAPASARGATHVSVYACPCACERACGCRLAYVRACAYTLYMHV